MKGIRFSKFFKKKSLQYVVVSLLTCVLTATVYFSRSISVFSNLRLFSTGKVQIRIDSSSSFTTKLINSVSRAFAAYCKNCIKSDELLPREKGCRVTVGFSATLLESIETLYLLNMKEDYKKALQFVQTEFNCSRIGWVNRHEFWSRGIGALIGAYTVTENKVFLERATQCADIVLSIEESEKYSFVNLKNQEGKTRKWQGGVAVSDLTAGMPELATLALITKNKKYDDALEEMYTKIPVQENQVSQIYSSTGASVAKTHPIDGYLTSFFYNGFLAVMLKDNSDLITFLCEAVAYLPSKFSKYGSIAFPFLDIMHYMEVTEIPAVIPFEDDLHTYVQNNFSKPLYPIFAVDKDVSVLGFNFEGAGLREMARRASNDEKGRDSVIRIVNEAFSRTRSGAAFSGIKKTSLQAASLNQAMSSNIFGQWASVGALAASGNIQLINTSVINERGHILRLKFPPHQ